jgi:outer membrane biosynthesis protein TonB
VSRSSVAFPRSYQRHLVTEQRKAVLAALRDRIGPEHTVGEVLDAAEALGWAEPMGDLSLADLAAALLTPIGVGSSAASEEEIEPEDDGDESDEDVVEDEAEDEAPPQRGRSGKKKAAKATKAPVAKGKKAAAKKKASARAPEPASKKTSKKAPAQKQNKKAQKQNKKAPSKAPAVTTARASKAQPAISKKTGKGRRAAPVDFDEPMSLEDAAGVLVPLVRSLGEATMQDLEEQTAGGRRKLRFHIGQLVRRGYLVRHGMGRGTFYTVG